MNDLSVTQLLDTIVGSLDIPKSYYEKAVSRHRSLGEWLCRPESRVAVFQPNVAPQGSFRYGTVTRSLFADSEYAHAAVDAGLVGATICWSIDCDASWGATGSPLFMCRYLPI